MLWRSIIIGDIQCTNPHSNFCLLARKRNFCTFSPNCRERSWARDDEYMPRMVAVRVLCFLPLLLFFYFILTGTTADRTDTEQRKQVNITGTETTSAKQEAGRRSKTLNKETGEQHKDHIIRRKELQFFTITQFHLS